MEGLMKQTGGHGYKNLAINLQTLKGVAERGRC
mgnify:CR=1 FL=1